MWERLFYVFFVYLKALEQFSDTLEVIFHGHIVGQFGRLYTSVNRQNGKENFEFSKCVPEVFLRSENDVLGLSLLFKRAETLYKLV